jgi:organic hydroperoxide reductase OsmC/OhrA
VPPRGKVFEYAVDVDRVGRMTIPGGASVDPAEGWMPDHLLLAALVTCSIESFRFHARRAGHEVAASGEAQGTVTQRESDGRYAFDQIAVRIDAQLTPRPTDTQDLISKAERDCFVGASLTIKPEYTWHVS